MRIRKGASRLLGAAYSSVLAPDSVPRLELPFPQPPPPQPYPESHAGGGCFLVDTASEEPCCDLNRLPWDLMGELGLSDSQRQIWQRIDVCVEDETVNYLNRKDVQEALHAKLIVVKNWAACSSVLEYELLNLQIPTINVVGSLLKSGIRVLVPRWDAIDMPNTKGTELPYQMKNCWNKMLS